MLVRAVVRAVVRLRVVVRSAAERSWKFRVPWKFWWAIDPRIFHQARIFHGNPAPSGLGVSIGVDGDGGDCEASSNLAALARCESVVRDRELRKLRGHGLPGLLAARGGEHADNARPAAVLLDEDQVGYASGLQPAVVAQPDRRGRA